LRCVVKKYIKNEIKDYLDTMQHKNKKITWKINFLTKKDTKDTKKRIEKILLS
jgi:hypothetical protein